jgi:hypothetical protein
LHHLPIAGNAIGPDGSARAHDARRQLLNVTASVDPQTGEMETILLDYEGDLLITHGLNDTIPL